MKNWLCRGMVAAIALSAAGGVVRADSITNGSIVGIAGKCLYVDPGRPMVDGTRVEIHFCTSPGNKWLRVNGEIRFQGTDKCLDVRQSNSSDGTPVQIWKCNGTAAQRWTTDTAQGPNGPGNLPASVVAEIRGIGGKCLDVPRSDSSDGTPWKYGHAMVVKTKTGDGSRDSRTQSHLHVVEPTAIGGRDSTGSGGTVNLAFTD